MDKKSYLQLKKKAHALHLSNGLAFLNLSIDVLIIALAIYLSLSSSLVLWGVGQLLTLIAIWRQFSILHSCAHNTFFKNKKMNKVTGYICSILSLLPFDDWKKSHLDHHIWAGDHHKDPSLNLPTANELSPLSIKVLNICWKLHIPIFSFLVVALKVFNKKQIVKVDPTSTINYSAIFLISVHFLLIIFLKLTYLKLFIVPFFLYLFTSDFLIISQHNLLGANQIDKSKFPLPVWEHFQVTRDLAMPPFIGKYVLLNFDQHNLHHLFPFVPHYHLNKIDTSEYNVGLKEHWFSWLKKVHALPGSKVYLE